MSLVDDSVVLGGKAGHRAHAARAGRAPGGYTWDEQKGFYLPLGQQRRRPPREEPKPEAACGPFLAFGRAEPEDPAAVGPPRALPGEPEDLPCEASRELYSSLFEDLREESVETIQHSVQEKARLLQETFETAAATLEEARGARAACKSMEQTWDRLTAATCEQVSASVEQTVRSAFGGVEQQQQRVEQSGKDLQQVSLDAVQELREEVQQLRRDQKQAADKLHAALIFIRDHQQLSLAQQQVKELSESFVSGSAGKMDQVFQLVDERTSGLSAKVHAEARRLDEKQQALHRETQAQLQRLQDTLAQQLEQQQRLHGEVLRHVQSCHDEVKLCARQRSVDQLRTDLEAQLATAEQGLRGQIEDVRAHLLKPELVTSVEDRVVACEAAVLAGVRRCEGAAQDLAQKNAASLAVHSKTPSIPGLLDKTSERLAGLLARQQKLLTEHAQAQREEIQALLADRPRKKERPLELDAASVRLLEEANTRLRALHRAVENLRLKGPAAPAAAEPAPVRLWGDDGYGFDPDDCPSTPGRSPR